MTIIIRYDKPHDGKLRHAAEEMVLRIWGFWKDSWGRPLKEAVEFFGSLLAEILNIAGCTTCVVGCQHRMVSIGFKELSLSSSHQRLKVEWIKSRSFLLYLHYYYYYYYYYYCCCCCCCYCCYYYFCYNYYCYFYYYYYYYYYYYWHLYVYTTHLIFNKIKDDGKSRFYQ